MKNTLFALIFFHAFMHLQGDGLSDFMAARRLFEGRKWSQSAESFQKTAEILQGRHRDLALSYAVRARLRLKQRAEAEQLLAKISSPGIRGYADMELLAWYGEWKTLTERYGSMDLKLWPEDLEYLGLYHRGEAWFRLRRYEKAREDFRKVTEQAGSDHLQLILALSFLQESELNLKHPDRALELGNRIMTFKKYKGFHAYMSSALLNVSILAERKQLAEAEKLLHELQSERTGWSAPVWHFRYLEACGDVAAAGGKAAEAEKYYRQGLELKNVHDYYRKKVERKLRKTTVR